MLDIKNTLLKKNKLLLIKITDFEVFEYSPALKLGLSDAIKNTNKIGIEKVEKNIKKLTTFFI